MPKAKPTKLTQSSLSFNNVKKTAASSSKNVAKARSPAVTVRKSAKADIEIYSDDDDATAGNKSEISVSSIRPSSPKPKKGKSKPRYDSETEEDEEFKTPALKKKAKAPAKSRKAKTVEEEVISTVFPIHAENETPEHQVLRCFDLSYDYGPCVGVTRMERWQRASSMGLNPPRTVFDILSAHEGQDYVQNVFHEQL